MSLEYSPSDAAAPERLVPTRARRSESVRVTFDRGSSHVPAERPWRVSVFGGGPASHSAAFPPEDDRDARMLRQAAIPLAREGRAAADLTPLDLLESGRRLRLARGVPEGADTVAGLMHLMAVRLTMQAAREAAGH